MDNFADRLTHQIQKLSNPTVVGLDPRLNQIPSFIKDSAIKQYNGKTLEAASAAIIAFNIGIIDSISDIVPAVKPQVAFYEQYGHAGFFAYEQTIKYAQEKGMIVIGDVKRNDIGSTAKGYADGHLGEVDLFDTPTSVINADCITVTPFFGTDSIEAYTKVCSEHGKGIFIMVRSSNSSADEIQGQPVGDHLMDEEIATLVEGWGRNLIGDSGYSSVGAVVGATYPEEAAGLRNLMPNQLFLVPGYGAQGGGAEDVRPCFHNNGTGAIVNSSRGIIFAYTKDDKWKDEQFGEAARSAAMTMKEDLNKLF